ncbi:RsmB/NOP family class I SAM-dependent RNA methyltransferase [Geobacter sulfurreducens]|uniref:RsmB/NOP family class I SAM-dependent RNA methyltransferase n=1 Tax=Geobacter sulfurreducens TaxID=35554 RepID=UPI000DBAEE99|nr:RsmB/NOP family class I SAM-dependent RNA methyltransferase [Geobacter sulfurreducens]QVW34568.1 RsmB/NOP family class I SAM-dependent RNA methyltransferase [Geobacter sulfurreducens]BBA71169.1 Ribosomal RNA small subunit methyltransferase F [Geobacter sulfurreducens]
MTDTGLPPLPVPFLALLEEVLPPDLRDACLASFSQEKPTSLRLNPLKGDPDETRRELESAGFDPVPVSWYPLAFTVDGERRRALTESPPFREGRIYIQSLSSMTAPLALAPEPGETVLDLAAAPGGKTAMMAAMMENRGRLSAVEAVRGRFFRMKANLDRQGATMVRTYLTDGRSVGRKCPEMFDRVLLDAPCSSEARFTRLNPESWAHWSPRKVEEAARKQRGLIRSALEALRPGGLLLYCTCSFSPEENELIVNDVLRRDGNNLRVCTVDLPLPNRRPGLTRWKGKELHPDLARSVRILPDRLMDGFFLCLIRKLPE